VTAVLTEPALDAQVSVRGEPLAGFPVEPNTAAEADGKTVLWLGPDEWLVLGGRVEDYAQAAAAIDVSANRVVLELAGPEAAEVLSGGCALDLDPGAFPPGRCAQTLLARAQVILLRREPGRWWLLVRPSFAPYLRAWLLDALASWRAVVYDAPAVNAIRGDFTLFGDSFGSSTSDPHE
jgi:sarcosine oxidase, subunit gamma